MIDPKRPVQLPLGITLRDEARFENFIVGENGLLFNSLRQAARGQGEQYLYLWGGASHGSSHLLQSSCHEAQAFGRSSVYLPLRELIDHPPGILDNMEQLQLVCIDDLDCIAGESAWQEAVFHLFNRMREVGHTLLIAAHKAPAQLGLALPDLVSRLNWGMVFHVYPINDEAKAVALKARAAGRGFELSDEVVHYLLHHGSRDMAHLLAVLERLDHASLSAQRRITVPFVKQEMGW
ncbi:DnaA regulatory inactivator Hda [Nitrincola tapanii]|uniref:DnaA regulatory inactivator Hda n=1 Tax=Nitrincola tapanii TaxID=1708751 RepID=A0A5A9W3T1_9GAMM|nr:DnaA regulatory inactivator Hda [Nitrincola tapanii]KAA0875154.1 DnaA regulatory inactivator Hda [Nitrincola tapanii]